MENQFKKIGEGEIKAILNTVYETNIPAKTFTMLQELFTNLPECTVEKPVEKPVEKGNVGISQTSPCSKLDVTPEVY